MSRPERGLTEGKKRRETIGAGVAERDANRRSEKFFNLQKWGESTRNEKAQNRSRKKLSYRRSLARAGEPMEQDQVTSSQKSWRERIPQGRG